MRFLLINGESFQFCFPQSTMIREVKQKLVDEKPSELLKFLQQTSPGSSVPTRTDEIRLLHLGRFLDDSKSLQGKLAKY